MAKWQVTFTQTTLIVHADDEEEAIKTAVDEYTSEPINIDAQEIDDDDDDDADDDEEEAEDDE